MTNQDGRYELICDEVREALSSAVGGEPSPSEDKAVAGHLLDCATCAAFKEEMAELDRHLQDHLDQRGETSRIWMRVRMSIGGERSLEEGRQVPRTGLTGRRGILGWGVAATVLAGIPLGALLRSTTKNHGQSFVTAVVDDFTDYQQSGDVLDIQARHPAVLRRWMTARVDFNLPANLSTPVGVHLAGGRLCSILGRKLAFFAYRSPTDAVGLYVTPASGLDFSASDRFFATARDDGLTTAAWQRDGLGYVVVSSASIGALDAFITHFRKAVA